MDEENSDPVPVGEDDDVYEMAPSPARQPSPVRGSNTPNENISVISNRSRQSPTEIRSVRTSKSPSISKSPVSQKKSESKTMRSNNASEPRSLKNPSLRPNQAKSINDHLDQLSASVRKFSQDIEAPPQPINDNNIDKIAHMSKFLANEASALRQSIRTLSEDIVRTKQELLTGYGPGLIQQEDVNFPYHLFLIEIIVNKIHMKCECFDVDLNNLVITASFLGKQPIVLYDISYGKIQNMSKLNVGKSTLFAMTYDKICSIKEFDIVVELTKQPPCTSCVTKIAETRMDYTKEFFDLRDELCKKWAKEQPHDNIMCTTSTPLSKNLYYLSCGDSDHQESIGVIEITVRMSFLGKEITTAFCGSSKSKATSWLSKDDNGMSMYSCQKVEMDDQGKVLLDEGVFNKSSYRSAPSRRSASPLSNMSIVSSKRSYEPVHYNNNYNCDDTMAKYDEILTKVNSNELKIKVPKSTRVQRSGKYDKIQELCSCEDTPYNTGDQIQFDLPTDLCSPDKSHKTFTNNLKYTYNGCTKSCDTKNRKIINVTPTNCPVPVAMEKVVHPQKDVFILKIGKKLECKDKRTDLEIELVTPKAPQPAHDNNNISQQCSTEQLKLKSSKKGKKDDKKGKKKSAKKKGKK